MNPTNFGELAWRAVATVPDRPALLQDDVELTHAELATRVRRVSAYVRSLGIERSEPVLLLLPNDWRFPESLLGVVHAGGLAAPLNIKLGPDALAHIAKDSGARILLTHSDVADRSADLGIEPAALVDADGWLEGPDEAEHPADVAPGDPALLMYTSGSTGNPKGVLLSHANKWWQARSSARCYFLTDEDRALVTGPLYHANALWACLLPMLYVGGSVAIAPRFDADEALRAIDRYRPTYTSGTPAMFTLLLQASDRAPELDLTCLEFLLCGSAPVPAELLDALHRRMGAEVLESYGLTEGGANVCTPRWGVKKLGSTGLPVPGVEIRVVPQDDSTRDCSPGEIGELWSRSGANAIGYLGMAELTAERITSDGWLKTSDLVRRDEQGYVYFVGRVDDMINVGGENVYPKEVETLLTAHPSVHDAVVVAVPHRVKGAAPVAWVVTDGEVTEAELREWALNRGPAYAHPRRVFLVEALPMTGTNKVDRKALEDEAKRLLPHGLDSERSEPFGAA